MRVSVVIPTHNRAVLLGQCLTGATRQDYADYEVIVVDDASADGTGQIVHERFPQVHYVRQQRNLGPAAARNRGVALAGGQIVAFTDDDCLVPADFLSRLVAGYLSYPEVAGVGGYLEAPPEVLHDNPFAQYEAYVSHHLYHAGADTYIGGFECPAGGTNSMSYRRAVLMDVGGFDESFPVPGGEDADLKLRVVQRGHQLLYTPVKVIHLHPYTLHSFWRQHHSHGRGAVHFERKHSGHAPSRTRLALRTGARLARWFQGIPRLGVRVCTVRLLAETADLAGQWYEVQRLRCH